MSIKIQFGSGWLPWLPKCCGLGVGLPLRSSEVNFLRVLPIFRRLRFLASFILLAGGCAVTPRPSAPPPDPQPYTRVFRGETNVVSLQVAMRKFVPHSRKEPVIWLVGASHIGDRRYYDAVQRHLDSQTLVLFEGINSGFHPRRAGVAGSKEKAPSIAAPAAPAKGESAQSTLQSTLAESLGLVFQLDGIEYERTNFLNSDLSVRQIQDLMNANTSPAEAGQDESGDQTFQTLLRMMDGSSFTGGLIRFGLKLIGTNPKAQAMVKLAFVEILGRLEGDMGGMKGLPPDMQKLMSVLIASRNQHVLADLKTEAPGLPRSSSVAIFYGAGHMDDFERRLTRDLNYRADQLVWVTAFSVDTQATGLSAGDVKMVQSLVQWQMRQLK